ncbi:hypothetical protein ASU35_11570 [Acetivibrio ethanolgignens]|uniref:Transposase n=1 Tax=Acetivibrio ethanolgignens TaxID=290052 RepID=A0A0V8QE11_9FIRM|nr:hypothetical protein ASU35_11570 [Acetivibrio ethanolgignens]
MTKAIYLEVTEMEETIHKVRHWVSVFRKLKHLGVSRFGYRAWQNVSFLIQKRDVKPSKQKKIYIPEKSLLGHFQKY